MCSGADFTDLTIISWGWFYVVHRRLWKLCVAVDDHLDVAPVPGGLKALKDWTSRCVVHRCRRRRRSWERLVGARGGQRRGRVGVGVGDRRGVRKMLRTSDDNRDVRVFLAGDQSLLSKPCVSIVGTREVSEEGRVRARRLSRELCEAGVVVVSDLARGVDTAAHTAAIGTPERDSLIPTPLNLSK